MVRRRSTVRFRKGAPAHRLVSNAFTGHLLAKVPFECHFRAVSSVRGAFPASGTGAVNKPDGAVAGQVLAAGIIVVNGHVPLTAARACPAGTRTPVPLCPGDAERAARSWGWPDGRTGTSGGLAGPGWSVRARLHVPQPACHPPAPQTASGIVRADRTSSSYTHCSCPVPQSPARRRTADLGAKRPRSGVQAVRRDDQWQTVRGFPAQRWSKACLTTSALMSGADGLRRSCAACANARA
jgi:hypothetical protein